MSKLRRTSDIISMLVNIYGSKELFVNEYRNLLADRILSQFNYDTEREIRVPGVAQTTVRGSTAPLLWGDVERWSQIQDVLTQS